MIKRNSFILLGLIVLTIITYYDYSMRASTVPTLNDSYTVKETKTDFTKIEYVNNIASNDLKDDTVLLMSIVNDKNSYGPGRNIAAFIAEINSLLYKKSLLSMGLLVSDESEFLTVNKLFDDYFKTNDLLNSFKKVTILYAPQIEAGVGINRENRHDDKLQRLRRKRLSRIRNFLINNSLELEKFTLSIDSDVNSINNKEMLLIFINSNLDIVVPRVSSDSNPDYDLNSWKGTRTKPNQQQLQLLDNNDWDNWHFVPGDVTGKMTHFKHVLKKISKSPSDDVSRRENYSIELDSVGGATLFVKSVILKQGIQFPPFYTIGTTWERDEGYDGVETEGLCYIAKTSGYQCYGMPNIVVNHSSD